MLFKVGSKNVHGCAQNTQNGISFDFFLERYHKDGHEFLSHIIGVTDDEFWVLFVNVEIKQHSEQWMHTHSPDKLKMFKEMSARKLMATVYGTGKEC
jgi:hypothetical protein